MPEGPEDRAREEINELLNPVGRVNHDNEEARTLANLCDALLPKLLLGEIRVKSANRFVETAL